MRLTRWSLLVAVILGGWGGEAAAACRLQTLAEYHLTMAGGMPLIEAKINGHPVRLLVDTGAWTTIISRPAAATLGLPRRHLNAVENYSVEGPDAVEASVIHEFQLGGQVERDVEVVITTRTVLPPDVQGLLGENFLAQADLELDLANGVMRLFKAQGCEGDQVVYWGKAYSVVPIAPTPDPNDLNLEVVLNGLRVVAVLDTGASRTIVNTPTARQAVPGVEDDTAAAFPTVQVGDETIRNARLAVTQVFAKETEIPTNSHLSRPVGGLPGMLLGVDFIRAHRIYVSRGQRKIFFSYNGGPIFSAPPPAAAAGP